MSNFGRVFKVTTFGESHSPSVGCIIEGLPANFKINQV
jgi:chorismate synthase